MITDFLTTTPSKESFMTIELRWSSSRCVTDCWYAKANMVWLLSLYPRTWNCAISNDLDWFSCLINVRLSRKHDLAANKSLMFTVLGRQNLCFRIWHSLSGLILLIGTLCLFAQLHKLVVPKGQKCWNPHSTMGFTKVLWHWRLVWLTKLTSNCKLLNLA